MEASGGQGWVRVTTRPPGAAPHHDREYISAQDMFCKCVMKGLTVRQMRAGWVKGQVIRGHTTSVIFLL